MSRLTSRAVAREAAERARNRAATLPGRSIEPKAVEARLRAEGFGANAAAAAVTAERSAQEGDRDAG